MNRGNRKVRIFEDDHDRRRFLSLLMEEKHTHGVDVDAGSLMGNHFHKIIGTPYGNLADFMGGVQGRFASYSNERHDHVGHLYQGRFRRVYIADDVHLLTALCYVFLNPVSAGLVKRLEDYHWSTYRATAGYDPIPRYLSLDWLNSLFPGEPLPAAQYRFRELMNEARPVYAYFHQHDTDIDAAAVKRVVRSHVGQRLRIATLPRMYRTVLRDSLPELFPAGRRGAQLAEAIYDARVVHGYRLIEIARHLRVHTATVSRIYRSVAKSRHET